jgi:hypothetical protein
MRIVANRDLVKREEEERARKEAERLVELEGPKKLSKNQKKRQKAKQKAKGPKGRGKYRWQRWQRWR